LFFLLLNTKDILKNVVNETVYGPHWKKKRIIWKSGSLTVWLPSPTYFKIYYFVFSRRQVWFVQVQVWNNLRVS